MSGPFLVSSKSECCCPEMRCCTPETVTVSVQGMSGATVEGFNAGGMIINTDDYEGWNVRAYCISLSDLFVLSGENPLSIEEVGYWACNAYEEGEVNFFNVSCFPKLTGSFSTGPGGGPPYTLANINYETDICEMWPKFCQQPGDVSYHWGPVKDTGGTSDIYVSLDEDLNGTYVCHRQDMYLRPQLKCRINRQVPLPDESPYRGVTEAQLLYNVDPRRTWVFLPPPWECWDVMFPPEGEEYCVDYRCGKRNPWYSAGGFGYCTRGKCTATNQGMAKPHLYAYHQSLNQTANLHLKLIPRDYEVDEHGRFPTYWRVGSVQVLNGGTGYSVGEFFRVDYESPQMRQWLGGEIMSAFPKMDESCFPPYYPTWIDKYGAVPSLDGGDKWIRWQTLRVSEVDGDGGIVSVEVVPIFKQPEFSDPPYCNDERVGEERTKFYVGYGRILCHPRSVQLPGVGYTIGDTIEFYCDDPSCEEIEPAIAEVVDVDEEGGILDWEIRGTDAWRYNSQNFCVAPFTVVDGLCTTSCIKEGEPDERGKYRWKAKLLCDLTWTAVGLPVRAVKNLGLFFPQCETALTQASVRISRVACETSIQVYVAPFPFSLDASGGVERARALFPPYPACAGGGAVVRPTYGAWGANESDFGSSLAGGVIEAGGGGYCFRDKYHVQPMLPTGVPSIGSGSGGVIAGFTFSAVNNFPNPAIDWGGQAPASNRFSYFPVTGATISQAGSGYAVGQTFEVSPDGGRAVSDMWRATGGDTPEQCPNGAWYDGERATVNAEGYRSILYNYETGQYLEPVSQRPSKCTLRISSVDANGGITGLEVVHGGMMFRTAWGNGKQNPLAIIWLQSTLGYGAYIEATFDTTWGSSAFGELTGVSVVPPPAGTIDPKHPFRPAEAWRPSIEASQMPVGGRDYADQSAGYFWMLQDMQIGHGSTVKWSLLAYYDWHGPSPYSHFHSELSTHNLIGGSAPTFVPKSSVCAFEDCYHSLLTRTYPLYRAWGGSKGRDDGAYPLGRFQPLSNGGGYFDIGPPSTGHAYLLRKDYAHNPTPFVPNATAYIVLEHGPSAVLGYTPSSPCPDHSNGTTTRE